MELQVHILISTNPIVFGEIKEEINRRNSSGFLDEIKKFLRTEIGFYPRVLDQPSNFLVAPLQLATPSIENISAGLIAEKLGLDFALLSYQEDRFAFSKLKSSYVRPKIWKTNKKRIRLGEIVDVNTIQGNQLDQIQTIEGLVLPNFYRTNFPIEVFFPDIYIEDVSRFFQACGTRATDYYNYAILLYVTNVFYRAPIEGPAKKIFDDVIFPAAEECQRRFGVKPICLEKRLEPKKRFDMIEYRDDFRDEYQRFFDERLRE